MRKTSLIPAIGLTAILTIVGGCVAAASTSGEATPSLMAAAPAHPVPDRQRIEAGAKVYGDSCVECHGEDLTGQGVAFNLKLLKADERPRFDAVMKAGKGMMPAWEGVLSPEDIDDLWAYIRSKGDR